MVRLQALCCRKTVRDVVREAKELPMMRVREEQTILASFKSDTDSVPRGNCALLNSESASFLSIYIIFVYIYIWLHAGNHIELGEEIRNTQIVR